MIALVRQSYEILITINPEIEGKEIY